MWCATSDAHRVRSERWPHLRNLSSTLKIGEISAHVETHKTHGTCTPSHEKHRQPGQLSSSWRPTLQTANCLTVSTLWENDRDGELCINEVLIWCRLAVLLQFTDNNHNEATPANLHSVESESSISQAHTVAFLSLSLFFRWSTKLQKKHRTFPQNCINFIELSNPDTSVVFASGRAPG